MSITFFVIFGFCLLFVAMASPLYGEIYSWTDENGIMNFTNYNPPPEARVFIKDINRPRHESDVAQNNRIDSEQRSVEQREIHEDREEKLNEATRRIKEFERSMEDTEVLNQSLERKLRAANQKADDALALLLAFGYAKTWHGDFHPISSVPCPAHTQN